MGVPHQCLVVVVRLYISTTTARVVEVRTFPHQRKGRRMSWNGTRRGRPPFYDRSPVFNHICERIAHGESLASICRDPSMPAESTVYRWLKNSREAEVLRQTLQRVDLEWEFQEFLREKYAHARG